MKALLYPSIHGLMVFNEQDELLQILWKNISIAELAEQYLNFIKGNVSEELMATIKELNSDNNLQLFLDNPQIVQSLNNIEGIHATTINDNKRLQIIQLNEIQHWMTGGVQFNANDVNIRSKTLSEYMIKAQIAETATQKDAQVKQAIDTIVDIDKSINFFITRLREWYGLHFPELTDKLIGDNHKFAEFVAKIGERSKITTDDLENILKFTPLRAKLILEKSKRSMGGPLDSKDLSSVRTLAQKILDYYDYREHLENYIDNTLQEITPNLRAVLGSNITAKLLSIAGSLEKLAMLPSSTVQVLGAEKALFKALKTKGNTPKYGVIFQWNKIRGEKSYLRGKVARMAAGKISILAKVDFYKGDFVGDKIGQEIDRKIEILQKQFPKPPKKKFQERPQSRNYQSKGRGSSNYQSKGRGSSNYQSKSRGSSNYQSKSRGSSNYQSKSRGSSNYQSRDGKDNKSNNYSKSRKQNQRNKERRT